MVSHSVGRDDTTAIRWVKLEALDPVPLNHGFALLAGAVQPSTWCGRLANGMDLLGSLGSSLGRTVSDSRNRCAGINTLASLSSIFSSGHSGKEEQTDDIGLDSGTGSVAYMPVRGTYAYDVLQRRFKELDKDGVSYISEGDLKVALKRLNLPTSEQDVQSSLNEMMGDSRTSKITFEKFAEYAISRENELVETFKDLDRQQTGYISVEQMKAAFQKYKFRFAGTEVEKMIGGARRGLIGSSSIHGDRTMLDFAEFRHLLMLSTEKDLRDSFEVWGRAKIDLGDADTSFPMSSGRHNKSARSGQRRKKPHIFRHLFAAGVSAAVTRTSVAPLERIKVMSMVNYKIWKNDYSHALSTIWRDEGIGGLFKGNFLNILRIAPTKVVEFLVYDKLKELRLRKTEQSDITGIERVASGSIASLTGTLVSHPIDTVRTAIIVQVGGHRKGIVECTKSILENKGFIGLYSGIIPMMIRVASYGAISFIVYDQLKERHRKKVGPGGKLGILPTAIFGALAGAFTQTAVHPLEIVQRRLQAQAGQQGPVIYHNMISAFKIIVREEGVKALYAGLEPNYLKLLPAAVISILIYELIKGKCDIKK